MQRWKAKKETKNIRRPKKERMKINVHRRKVRREGQKNLFKVCLIFSEKKYIIGIYSTETEAKLTRLLLYCFLPCKAKLVAVPRVTRNQITQLWHSYLISADRNTSHRNVCLLASSR